MLDFLKYVYYWLVTGLAAVASFCFYPCRVIGRGNMPKKGGFILASNHESNIDPVLLPVASPRRLRFLAKDSLFKNPVLGFLISFGGGIPLRRGAADRGALSEALRTLESGGAVLIFPQGTRGGERVQAGVGFLAVKSGAPVVPVYIDGTQKVLPKGASWPKRTPVKVRIGKPLRFGSELDSAAVSEKIMQAVWSLRQ